jgi:hypothetical protein
MNFSMDLMDANESVLKKRPISEIASQQPPLIPISSSILARALVLENSIAPKPNPVPKSAVPILSESVASQKSVLGPRKGPNNDIRQAQVVTKLNKVTKAVPKNETAHVLLWICSHGKGQGRQWKAKSLKVIGVYANKAAAERKKQEIMSRYDCCGHGDIVVGDTWEDEIDLVIRPCEVDL